MRDKIVIMGGAYKIAKRPPVKRKKKKKGERQQRKSDRERIVNFRETNNAPMVISPESTIGSCCVLNILCLSHSYTNGPQGLDKTQSV